MTETELRIVHRLMRIIVGQYEAQNILSGLLRNHRMGNKPLSNYHRDWLLTLAWENRHHLPADLAVIVALNGGADGEQ